MLALGIIILILILILILPVGADAAYADNVFSLAVKAGPFRIGVLPPKSGDKKEEKTKKEKKKRGKSPEEDSAEKDKKAKKSKLKLSFDDIMGIIRIGLNTLGRFWRSISIDKLKLHLVTAGPDPYDAVMNYGYINAALGALMPLLHRVFKIKDEDYASDIDFQAEKMKIDARIILTIRIGEILLVVLCAAFAFIKWFLQLKRKNKVKAKAEAKHVNEKKSEKSSAQKGN